MTVATRKQWPSGFFGWRLCLCVSASILLLMISIPFPAGTSYLAAAEVTTSITPTIGQGDLGTIATPAGNSHNITGGTRAGHNLFHSFRNFSVGAADTANFLNTPINGALPLTSNILARVTGENTSNIFGTIRTTGFGSADLFLINPSGVVFGPNATLHVGGSVSFTTADYIRLTDNVRFNALPNATSDSLFSTEPVAAYGFLGSNSSPHYSRLTA